jgi:hypothetical protein
MYQNLVHHISLGYVLVLSKVAGHIPARISDVPSWDAETIFI